MKRGTIICAITLLTSAVPALATDERTREGKPLSVWLALATDHNSVRRDKAIDPLRRFDSKTPGLVPGVIELLRDPEYSVQLDAARLLADLGAKDRSVIPFLIRAMEDPDPAVRRAYCARSNVMGPIRTNVLRQCSLE
jgi:hypothetical protein